MSAIAKLSAFTESLSSGQNKPTSALAIASASITALSQLFLMNVKNFFIFMGPPPPFFPL